MPEIKPLSEELQKIAIDELGEVSSRIDQYLEDFRSWIELQPHLKIRMDDQYLIQFLRGSKYSLEKAKQKLTYTCLIKTKFPKMFRLTNIDDKIFRKMVSAGSLLPLPIPLYGNGPRIILERFVYPITTNYNIENYVQLMCALHEVLAFDDPHAGVCGLVYIMDFTKLQKDHLAGLTITLLKFLISLKEKALAMRLRAIYLINLKPYAEQILKMGLSIMPEALKKKMIVCGKDLSSLPESLPLKYLPRDYGGENSSLDELREDHIKMWEKYREFFEMNSCFDFDEKLFMGEPICGDEVQFGAGGSFRKIEVD
ncbi:retinaldehyde-binding protein 1-like [Musca vetustissima]|uniref:retinaldehyde-binding protein 1-like n=1 Tax=Musca vetustissima TaxID=27455 RepID=UPI002AB5FA5C|nr:retinaldehyde-binding protein 1-like [Musca vetustissima]XP_061393119.1 retinaldehyde-binding protein 1-like [Musca vetustissima]